MNSKYPPISIPVARPDISGNEEKYVVDAIRSSWISSIGGYIDRFEREFATECGAQSALAVSNGTVALHLALLTLGVGRGDEVLVPSMTFVATANAVRYVGAEPVFIDVDPANWCLDPRLIEPAITPRTKAIIAVHAYGHPADMDAINNIAEKHGLAVVEDAAEAHFATCRGRTVGGLSDLATFSFYGNKIFTSGEGGALTVQDAEREKLARLLRDQGMDPQRRYYFPVTGHNFRLTNVGAAMLCAQLERKDEILAKRRAIYAVYDDLLSGIDGIGRQPASDWATVAPWLYCITIDEKVFGFSRDQVMEELRRQGLDSRPFFIPLHTLPPFAKESQLRGEHLPVTDTLGATGMNLPTYPDMTHEEVATVCHAIGSLRKN
jgi:perosamine synthetase